MGLDQYAYSCDPGLIKGDVDFERPEASNEIFYWRKHPDLQGWMRNLYASKGGSDEQFNCVPVRLTEEDLNELEEAVRDGDLPRTVGFFFGESNEDEDKEGDLEFIRLARHELAEGKAVFYYSWW